MMIYLGTDHRGYELKEKIKSWLSDWGYEYEDLGNFELDQNDDYPDFIAPVAQRVSKDPESRGIVLGASGQGEAITANKFAGVRAVVFYGGPEDIVRLSREHNDANILSIGASFVDDGEIQGSIKLWLETDFTNEERHQRRIEKIKNLEK